MVQLQPIPPTASSQPDGATIENPRPEIIYPDSDGKPMADNTKQFRWIVTLKENLECLFANDPNVFIAGDLLWYPVQGDNKTACAPDVMVVFGRPKGDRGSYKQWVEDNLAPQVVFEVLSPNNTPSEMNRKLFFYHRFGVEEYYLYDPDSNQLRGWQRVDEFLDLIEPIDQFISPRLGIRFDLSQAELAVFYPDGKRFSSLIEVTTQLTQTEQQLAQERQRAERLAERLRALGIEPDTL